MKEPPHPTVPLADFYQACNELRECQNARRSEHDLRVKFQGEAETAIKLLLDACELLDAALIDQFGDIQKTMAEMLLKRVANAQPGSNMPSQ